jgi:hypothetical protein
VEEHPGALHARASQRHVEVTLRRGAKPRRDELTVLEEPIERGIEATAPLKHRRDRRLGLSARRH